ncbi:TA system antitoxin ParD family protein [Arthrobacter sp. A5]|uniref:TA system antitoxin ParD family protein n=1 Tax=Arthrobacter sp. A5 TaxID=576926 RepID=UPI003DA870AC
MKTMPTRIDGELFGAAKVAGEIQSRSAAQQLDHWARNGRELEASPIITHGAINKVLTAQSSYDSLPDAAQAMVRVAWDEQISAKIAGLSLKDRLQEAGRPWAEADKQGHAVVRNPSANPA